MWQARKSIQASNEIVALFQALVLKFALVSVYLHFDRNIDIGWVSFGLHTVLNKCHRKVNNHYVPIWKFSENLRNV